MKKMIGVLIALKLDPHTYETVLGAILPEWQAKGAGISLYAYEFDVLKKETAGHCTAVFLQIIQLH